MNRLTERTMDNVYYSKGKYPPATLCAEMETWEVRECMAKLATYEDTGFEPEQVKQLNDAFKNSQKKLEKAFDDLEALNLAISSLEKQLNGGWIPVKERLPKQYNEYDSLISNDTDTKMHMVSNLVMVTVINHETNLLFVSNDIVVDGEWANFPNNILGDNYEIIAWQELPVPYKEEEDEP